MNKRSKIIVWIVIGVIATVLIGILMSDVIGGAKQIAFSELMQLIDAQKIQKVYVDAYEWTAVALDGTKYVAIGSSIYDAAGIEIVKQLTAQGISVEMIDPNSGSLLSSLLPFLGVVVIALIFWFMMRSASGANQANMNIGKNKAQMQSNLKVRFADIAGAEEEKEELKEVVDFLKAPKKFSSLGARIPYNNVW